MEASPSQGCDFRTNPLTGPGSFDRIPVPRCGTGMHGSPSMRPSGAVFDRMNGIYRMPAIVPRPVQWVTCGAMDPWVSVIS
jgi:hypothetical protein